MDLAQRFQQILQMQQAGQVEEALKACRKVLRAHPSQPQFNHIAGMLHAQMGNMPEAISALERCLRMAPALTEARYNLAYAYNLTGDHAKAAEHYEIVLRDKPTDANALNNYASTLQELGRVADAVDVYRRLVEQGPQLPLAHFNLGLALHGCGKLDEALACFEKVLELDANQADAYFSRANVLSDQGRHEEAIAAFSSALALRPRWPQALANRALSYIALDRATDALADCTEAQSVDFFLNTARAAIKLHHFDTAILLLDVVLKSDPSHREALNSKIEALQALDHHQDAIACLQLLLAEEQSAVTLASKAVSLAALDLVEEALASFDQALTLAPQSGEILCARGKLLFDLGRFEDAKSDLEHGLQLKADEPAGHMNIGLYHLLHGDYAQAWPHYEWRSDIAAFAPRLLPHAPELLSKLDRWQSAEDFNGKKVLVMDEQGVGDVIMFASVLPDLIERAAHVELVMPQRLSGLMSLAFPSVKIRCWEDLPNGPQISGFDKVMLIGSLAHAFRSTSQAFPGGAFLRVDEHKMTEWRNRIAAQGRKVIALSWRGGTPKTRSNDRSLTLTDFLPLLQREDLHCVSIQFGQSEKEVQDFCAANQCRLQTFPSQDTNALDDLAALIAACDHVVTVQNANVHLSGALGRDCTAIIPAVPEWRYGLSGSRMSWYKSVKLIRRSENAPLHSLLSDIFQTI